MRPRYLVDKGEDDVGQRASWCVDENEQPITRIEKRRNE